MTTLAAKPSSAPPVPSGALSEIDLAEMLGAFNEVTAKLHAAHESLHAEVVRLRGELARANEQIERSRRLAALGEMAAGIAHEVRNPLGSIRLYARMLEQDLAERPAERSLAEKIGAAVRGVDAVVTDVLAFAREMRVRAQSLEAGEILSAAVEECVGGAGGAGRWPVRVERADRRSGGDRLEVECDAALVHRAMVNVVQNALQAMEAAREAGDGRESVLTVDAEERTVAGADGAPVRCAALSVRDTGPGVSPEVVERMFNPFFTTRATGTGLGLAIVHRIVDAHGGRVAVRNARTGGGGGEGRDGEERGAVVEVLLPARGAGSLPSAAAGSAADPSGPAAGRARVKERTA